MVQSNMNSLEGYPQLLDLFSEEGRERLTGNEEKYIATLKSFGNQCYALKSADEKKALPYLDYINQFLERLLQEEDPVAAFGPFGELQEYVMESFFPKLTSMILKAGYFSMTMVLDACYLFYRQVVLLSLKIFIKGDDKFLPSLEKALKNDLKFYTKNASKCSFDENPFGSPMLGVTQGADEWVELLKVGDIVDAVKVDNINQIRHWTRAEVVEVSTASLSIKYQRSPARNIISRVQKTPFILAPLDSRCTDWQWRESLKVGEQVDYFMDTIKEKLWILAEIVAINKVTESTINYGDVEVIYLNLRELNSGDPFEVSISLHSGNVQRPGRFSEMGKLFYPFYSDDCLENPSIKMYAVVRTEGVTSKSTSKILHCADFVTLINEFGLNGGFEHFKTLIENPEGVNPDYINTFMSILANCGPFFLDTFCLEYCKPLAQKCIDIMMDSPPEVVRNFTKELIDNCTKALDTIWLRTEEEYDGYAKAERFQLEISFKCLQSDFLERKMQGLNIITDLSDRITQRDVISLKKEDIAKKFKEANLLEGIMKGHAQLITRSEGILKLLFSLEMIGAQELELIWGSIRKGDLETKNAIMAILLDSYYELSLDCSKFFIERSVQVSPKELNVEEILFTTKLVQFLPSHSLVEENGQSVAGELVNQLVMMMWRVATSKDVKDTEIIKASTNKLIELIKDGSEVRVEGQILDEAITNIQENIAVLQSLKVIRKIIDLQEDKEELVKKLIDKEVITTIFLNLKTFKSEIEALLQEKAKEINKESIAELLKGERYSFEKHVLKRIQFIDFILFASEPSNEQILSVVNSIWDALVVNCLVSVESTYFRKWFTKYFTGKPSNGVVTLDFLKNFFYDKIKFLSDKNLRLSKIEMFCIFSEIFLRINHMVDKLDEKIVKLTEQVAYGTNEVVKEEVREYISRVDPEELAGMEALWEIAMSTESELLADRLIDFIVNFYVKPQEASADFDSSSFQQYSTDYILKCTNVIRSTQALEDASSPSNTLKVHRAILMLQSIVDVTSSRGVAKHQPLTRFFKGQQINLTVQNKMPLYQYRQDFVKLQVNHNTTIFEVRQMTAKALKIASWKEIVLERTPRKTPQIKEQHNALTLRDLGIGILEKLKAVQPLVPIIKKEPLVDQNVINPKAIAAFSEAYDDLAVDGIMNTEGVKNFINTVLNDNCTADSQKVLDFIKSIGGVSKEYVTREEFIKFYSDSCFNGKQQAVLNNMKDLGFNPDFTKKNLSPSDLRLSEEELAGHIISTNDGVFQEVFDLLSGPQEVAEQAWKLLNRLPPAQKILKALLNFEGIEEGKPESWLTLVQTESAYKTMYFLYLIDYMMVENVSEGLMDLSEVVDRPEGEALDMEEFQKHWKTQFIRKGGFNHLINIMMSFVGSGISSKVDLQLFVFILDILNKFIGAAVTIKRPDLFRCLAFVQNSMIPLKYLLDEENPKEEEKQETKEVEQPPQTDNSGVFTVALYNQDTPQMIGPKLPISAATQNGEGDKKVVTYAEKIRNKLRETENFKEFRSSLQSALGDDPIQDLDVLSILNLLISLSETILVGGEKPIELGELVPIRLCLTISLALLLRDPVLLDEVLLSDKHRFLKEDSPMKIAGMSDYISYFMGGLLTTRSNYISDYFKHGFAVIMRKCENVGIQKMLLKLIFDNILKEGNSGPEASRYLELASPILEEICAPREEGKAQLSKEDLNQIIDVKHLFNKIVDLLLDQTVYEETEKLSQTELMVGYFNVLKRVVEIEPKAKQNQQALIQRIFSECLFNLTTEEPVKCSNTYTREAAYQFVIEMCKGCPENSQALLDGGMIDLSDNLPVVNSWSYTPMNTRKSMHGFVGIYNLSCICYMNAMLQQFYMTPTFRYGILTANDYQEENMQEEKGNQYDDNIFHQLQEMFAFLDSSERKDYVPKKFCYSFKDWDLKPVDVTVQQDTQEFLNRIFDKLETALKPTPFKNWMHSVYGGRLCNEFTCSGCSNVNRRIENFYNITLEVRNYKNMEEGLAKFIKEDVISDYRCDSCGNKCDYIKRCFVKEFPNNFIVHLKRIDYDYEVFRLMKINNNYPFPKKINLKSISLQKYDEDKQTEAAEGGQPAQPEAEQEVEADEDQKKGQEEEEEEEGKEEKKEPEPIQTFSDSYFDYVLKGVLIHRGSAEYGHYYSYINVNRGDPARPNNTKDKWIEFNDSQISKFNVGDLEKECFGEDSAEGGATIDIDYMQMGVLDKLEKAANNRNAYILIYEKVEKNPLTFTFNEKNLKEKDHILKNLVKPDRVDAAVFTEDHEKKEYELQVDYYDIQRYIPENLASTVKDDNLKFQIEQHVYSGSFLKFLKGLSELDCIPDFKPKDYPNQIYLHEKPVPKDVISVLRKTVHVLLNCFRTILPRSSENTAIERLSSQFIKIISYYPQLAGEVLESIRNNDCLLITLLTTCRDSSFRRYTSKILCHLFRVYVHSTNFDILSLEGEEVESNMIVQILVKAIMMMETIAKAHNYKRMGGYFNIWYTLAQTNDSMKIYLIKTLTVLNYLLKLYMSKKSAANDNKTYFYHEKALNPLLKTVAVLVEFIRDESLKDHQRVILDTESNCIIFHHDFYQKILKENYSFNQYKALKKLIRVVCENNEAMSKLMIQLSINKMSMFSEHLSGYLESLAVLASLQDSILESRLDLIFGTPTILSTENYTQSRRFGLQCNKHLNQPMVEFISTLNLDLNNESLLQTAVVNRDRNEGAVFVVLTFILEMANQSKDVFYRILAMPSPFAIYANFHDWIFAFVDEFLNGDERYTYASSNQFAQNYLSKMKDNLICFEENIRNHFRVSLPHVTEEEYNIVSPSSTFIFLDKVQRQSIPVIPVKPFYQLVRWPLYGKCIREQIAQDFLVENSLERKVILRVSQVVLLAIDSVPNGEMNMSIPPASLTRYKIYENDVPSQTNFSKFLDFVYPKIQIEKPKMAFLTEEEEEKSSGKKKVLLDYNEDEATTDQSTAVNSSLKLNFTKEDVISLNSEESGEAKAVEQSNAETGAETGAQTDQAVAPAPNNLEQVEEEKKEVEVEAGPPQNKVENMQQFEVASREAADVLKQAY